jgi:cytochrome P450
MNNHSSKNVTHTIKDQSISCDPGNPGFFNNPYPVYDVVRNAGPCFFWEEYNIWCFADHAGVSAILRDRRLGRELPDNDLVETAPNHLKPFYRFEANSILELEPPAHTRLRRLINRAFISRQIETLQPKISLLAHQLIDEFEGNQEVNLLTEFAEIIPVQIIAEMLGVPVVHSKQLLSWSHDMVAMYQHNRSRQIEDAAVKATQEFSEFILQVVAERRKHLSHDLISHLIEQQNKGETISDDELVTTCILLLNAGHEATVHAIGNGVKSLLECLENPTSIFKGHNNADAICEEIMRYDPPLHKFTRYVLEDIEIGGRTFSKGDTVGLLLAAANRDPGKFENPNQLIFDRPGLISANMAFGAGIHFCIGAPLARLEMQTALPILFDRLPKLKLAAGPLYADRYHFHGLEKLQLSWQ